MKVALAAFGLLGLAGCVRPAEGLVREQAASAFACADYALQIEEVGPDVYRASGCGQELVYACRAVVPRHRAMAAPPATPHRPPRDTDEFADTAAEPVMECARQP